MWLVQNVLSRPKAGAPSIYSVAPRPVQCGLSAIMSFSNTTDSSGGCLRRDLARGHRARVTLDAFNIAFDLLVAGLRQELPKLAAFGLVHERPRDTQRLRERFDERLSYYLDAEK